MAVDRRNAERKTEMKNNAIDLWMAERWAESFGETLSSLTDESPQFALRADQARSFSAKAVVWREPFNLAAAASLLITAEEDCWSMIGRRVLQAARPGDPDEGEARRAFIQAIRQATAHFAQVLSTRLGFPISCFDGEELEEQPSGPCFQAEFEFSDVTASVQILIPAPFLAYLDQPVSPGILDRPSSTSLNSQLSPAGGPRTLDVLLDVELPVSISFGRTQMQIRDVLKLSTGSIVELNRAVSEPVEVIVNNCVIARGEVVVVDGNYGVRVHEIVSRTERLRSTNMNGNGRGERALSA